MLMLDTNAIIEYLGGDQALVSCIDGRGQNEEIALATIAVVEVLGYPALTNDDEKHIEEFLRTAIIFELTVPLAKEAARLRRQYHITTADAVIVATAIHARAPLITRDKKLTRITELTCIAP